MSAEEAQVVQQEELSEIQQLARQGKFKEGPGYVHCIICEKKSYPAETVNFEKLPYHKECFKCTKCAKKIEGGFNAAKFEHNLYCRGCFQQSGFNRQQAQVKWTPKESGSQSAANPAFAGLGGGAETCKVCEKKVYSAEAVLFEKEKYHPDCLRCQEDGCGVLCTVSNLNKFDNKIYCGSCWNKGDYRKKQLTQAAPGVKASGQYSAVTLQLGGGGVKCTTCDKTCYPAETITFEKKPYHSECLKCSECALKMTLSEANQFEEQLYCRKCWNKGGFVQKQRDAAQKWTPKESTEVNPIAAKLGGGAETCKVCDKKVYSAEAVLFEKEKYHPDCLRCQEDGCGVLCTVSDLSKFEDKIYCKSCWSKGGFVQKQRDAAQKWTPKETTEVNAIGAKLGGGGLKCRTCEKTVYPAEALLYETFHYHSQCFKCTHCQKRIENINGAQHNRKNPYHTRCFQELNLHRPENA